METYSPHPLLFPPNFFLGRPKGRPQCACEAADAGASQSTDKGAAELVAGGLVLLGAEITYPSPDRCTYRSSSSNRAFKGAK